MSYDPILFNMMQCRAALGIQIKTGMRYSKGSVLKHAQAMGYTTATKLRAAYDEINQKIIEKGGEDRPLDKGAQS